MVVCRWYIREVWFLFVIGFFFCLKEGDIVGKRYVLLLDVGFVKCKIKWDFGGVIVLNIEWLVVFICKYEVVLGFEFYCIYYYDVVFLGRLVDYLFMGEFIEYGSIDVFNENVVLFKEVVKFLYFVFCKGECMYDGWSV